MRRISIAQDTVKILDIGSYTSPIGKEVNVGQSLRCCLAATEYYEPDNLLEIQQKILGSEPQYYSTDFEVKNETSLMGSQRISASQEFEKICILNFASAKKSWWWFS